MYYYYYYQLYSFILIIIIYHYSVIITSITIYVWLYGGGGGESAPSRTPPGVEGYSGTSNVRGLTPFVITRFILGLSDTDNLHVNVNGLTNGRRAPQASLVDLVTDACNRVCSGRTPSIRQYWRVVVALVTSLLVELVSSMLVASVVSW